MIQTRALRKRLGTVLAVDDVSLEIGEGLTAIIGPNGAGKSTLLTLIGRLVRADAGTAVVGGLDVAATPSKELARHLAILRQHNHLPIRLTVGDLVGFGRHPHQRRGRGRGRSLEDVAAVERALAQLGLEELRERYLDELSGGQQQRAFVAMALAQETDYLLLDEPLNNLDPRHSIELMKLLVELVDARGLRIVVVMHDINMAAQFADTIVAMRDGRVVAHGTVEEVVAVRPLVEIYETPVRVEAIGPRRVVLWD